MTLTQPFNPLELVVVLPEALLVLLALAILTIDVASSRRMDRRALGWITAAGLLIVLAASLLVIPGENQTTYLLGNMLRADLYGWSFRAIFLVGGALTAIIAAEFKLMRAQGEFYALLVLSVMAMGLMAASFDMIMLYLATETASIALYLMAGFMRDTPRSAEAGLKYFVFGAVTSTVMLYGLSLLYGMTGATNYVLVGQALAGGNGSNAISALALLMVLAGFAFKTSAVPFHFWAPDVYEGAPTPVTGFISTASKAAGFSILLRFLFFVFPPDSVATASVWLRFMMPVAILTMFAGNLLAITQTNIKRMLAYSSIAQAGYVLIGVTAFAFTASATTGVAAGVRADAIASVLFYLATYMLTNIVAFGVVGVVAYKVGGEDIALFTGLSKRSPYLALATVAALLSLAGAPPLVGFIGKMFIFRAALNSPELVGLVVAGVVNVLISVFYYLGVVRAMYADSSDAPLRPVYVPRATALAIGLAAIGLVFTSIAAAPFWNLAVSAARAFLN